MPGRPMRRAPTALSSPDARRDDHHSPWAFWTVVALLLATFLILLAKSGWLVASPTSRNRDGMRAADGSPMTLGSPPAWVQFAMVDTSG